MQDWCEIMEEREGNIQDGYLDTRESPHRTP